MEYIINNNLIPGNECSVTLKIVPRIVGKNIVKYNDAQRQKIIHQLKPEKCPNCGGPIKINEDSPYIYQCVEYYQGCCDFNILKRAKEVLGIKGIAEKGLRAMAIDPDFDLYKWLKEQKPTHR